MSALAPHQAVSSARVRPPAWVIATLLSCVGYVAWHVSGPGRGPWAQIISLGYLTILSIAAVWAMYRATVRPDLPDRIRRGLRYILAGMAAVLAGSVYLVIQYIWRGTAPGTFGVVDALFMCAYPMSAIGLLQFPRAPHLPSGRWRIVVDGVAFVIGVGVPLWIFAIQPVLASSAWLDALLIVLWPVMAFLGIMVVNASLLTNPPLPSRGAFWLLLGALGLSWVGDLVFALDAAAKVVTHGTINWINIINAISLVLFAGSAWRFQTDRMPARRNVGPAAFSPVPMLTIGAVAAWSVLIVRYGPADVDQFRHLLTCLIILLIVILFRETFVVRDSLRWVAAEAVRESQARFAAMFRHSSDVILVTGADRRVALAGPAAGTVLGIAPADLAGRDVLDLVHERDRAAGEAFFAALAAAGGPASVHSVRWRFRHADGTYRHFETSGTNLLDEPAISGCVLNSRDVTERLLLEERLHQAQKMEAVGRLAGGVAHDFNNLLAVVLANSELALMDLPENHPVRTEIEEIRRAANRGATLTGRLLSFGRRENLQPQTVAPARVLEDTLASLQRTVGDTVVLSHRIARGLGSVLVDPRDLEQALVNLAANARDAMSAGGTFSIELRPETLTRALPSAYLTARPGRYVVVSVTDSGSGMDETTRSRLFEPFFSTKAKSKGAGLGLAAVFGMVKTAGGGIVVTSALGSGTTIELWLPEVAPAVEELPVPARNAAGPGGGTILLVEDEAGVRRATQRILEANGFTVLSAGNAREAREVLRDNAATPIRLLLTDVIMPGESGPVLAADVMRQRPELKVLFMSGYTGDELHSEELTRAGGQLLIKPFNATSLLDRIRVVLDRAA
ncbi:MAG TPA: ATP-binding protein [Candidatus Didemnitutus sp.]|nr:ATP-binding protein [Candidatus Didemnitutus sp.]